MLKQSLQPVSVVEQQAVLSLFANLPETQVLHLVLSSSLQSVQPSIILQQRGGLSEFKMKPDSQAEHTVGVLGRHLLQFGIRVKSV